MPLPFHRSAAAICLLLTVGPWPFPNALAKAPGELWHDDLEAARAEARRTDKPVLVYFDAQWCSWCHQYERETLSKARVRRALRRHTVPVRVDWDARSDLVNRYGGRGLPFNVLLTPDGELVRRFTGILPPEDLIRLVRAASLEGHEPAHEPGLRPEALDGEGYRAYRRAFLDHLERLYDPEIGTLAGRFETGTGLKRVQPLSWMWLADHGLWPKRRTSAARADMERVWDRLDGGFFYYADPHRPGGHVETAKLLEHNAWMTAWLAGIEEGQARQAAQSGWFFLREVLWDPDGGFWRGQIADEDYYKLPPAKRVARSTPPVRRLKLADANAQASLALLEAAGHLQRPAMVDYGARALDFVLGALLHGGHLYHVLSDGERKVADLPADLFWVLIAGAKLQGETSDRDGDDRLARVANIAGKWLEARMKEEAPDLRTEVAGLAANACGRRERYPQLPEGCQAWALERLALRAETRPDWVIMGLRAWEDRLAADTDGEG